MVYFLCPKYSPFQSTLLIRGVTSVSHLIAIHQRQFQSTLLIRGVTWWLMRSASLMKFQSTLLIRGVTMTFKSWLSGDIKFQSTLLIRGVTVFTFANRFAISISIHTPHTRSDMTLTSSPSSKRNFNPHSSYEE